MKARTFNSIFSKYNELWASKVLNIPLNQGKGPDLINGKKAVEIKFKLIYENKYSDKCWRVLGDQLDYCKEYSDFYWGLGFYGLTKEIKNVSSKDFFKLDELVKYREIYLIKGKWMNQFPKYHQSGSTFISKWDHEIIYPRFNKFPKIISSEDVFQGKVFFTENVKKEEFNLNFDEFDFHKFEDKDVPF